MNNLVVITISDTGVGISAENLKKLFRFEEQLKTEGTDREKGSGLGLVLCKEILEKNGGRIWAESTEGEGSRFSFTLPLNSGI
jgi:signal transduction histidine kinase